MCADGECEAGATGICTTCGENRAGLPDCPCVDGYYAEGEACVACSYECITCSDAETCTLCAGNRIGNDCECPAGTHDTLEAECPFCPDECLECDDDGTCSECNVHRSGEPECLCDSGHYETTIDGTRVCEVCDVRCEECNTVYYQCDSCAVDSLREDFPECSCPIGYWDPCGANDFTYISTEDTTGEGSIAVSEDSSVLIGTTDRCEEA